MFQPHSVAVVDVVRLKNKPGTWRIVGKNKQTEFTVEHACFYTLINKKLDDYVVEGVIEVFCCL